MFILPVPVMLLEFKSKSPPNCGVVSSITFVNFVSCSNLPWLADNGLSALVEIKSLITSVDFNIFVKSVNLVQFTPSLLYKPASFLFTNLTPESFKTI